MFGRCIRKIAYNLCLVGGLEWSVWGWWIPGFWWSRSHLKSHLCLGQLSPTLWAIKSHIGLGLWAVFWIPPVQWLIFLLAPLGHSFWHWARALGGRWSPSKHFARRSTLRWPSILIGLGQPLERLGLSREFPCSFNLGGGRITSSWLSINGWRKFQLAFNGLAGH